MSERHSISDIRQAIRLLTGMDDGDVPLRTAESLRSVAKQVGMSPSGLIKFLNGGAPYLKTARKLRLWYQRREAEMDDALQRAALTALLARIPEEHKEQAVREILAVIDQLVEEAVKASD